MSRPRSIPLSSTLLIIAMATLFSCVSEGSAAAKRPKSEPGKQAAAANGPSKKIIVTDGAAKEKYGARLVSMSTDAPDDLLELVFDSDKDFQPSWSISSTAGANTGKSIEYLKSGPLKKIFDISFASAGGYVFTLYAYDNASKANDPIMSFQIEATGLQVPASLPENWSAPKRFRLYGITLKNASPRTAGDTLSFELEMPPGTKMNCTLLHKESKSYSFVRETPVSETTSRFAAPLFKPGEYSLSLSVIPAGASYPVLLAQASYVADLPKDAAQFRVEGDDPWPRLPVSSVQTIAEAYYAPAGSFPYETRYRATLEDDFAIKAPRGSMKLKKGSALDFGCRNGTTMVTLFEFKLDADISRVVDGKTLSFKAGTKYAFDESYEGGTISSPATLPLEGIEIDCPKGCYVAFDKDGLAAQIIPAGTLVLRAGGKSLTCEGEIYLGMRPYEEEKFEVWATLAKPASFEFGGASFTLPPGSAVGTLKGAFCGFVTGKEMDIAIGGKKSRVAASTNLSLDEAGSLKMREAKGGK